MGDKNDLRGGLEGYKFNDLPELGLNIDSIEEYQYEDIFDEEHERVKSLSWRDRAREKWFGDHGIIEVVLISLLALSAWVNLIVRLMSSS